MMDGRVQGRSKSPESPYLDDKNPTKDEWVSKKLQNEEPPSN